MLIGNSTKKLQIFIFMVLVSANSWGGFIEDNVTDVNGGKSVGSNGFLMLDDGSTQETGFISTSGGANDFSEVKIDGPGTTVILNGSTVPNRFDIAQWGTTTVTISGGAFVDGTQNRTGCSVGACAAFVSNAAGSDGRITITGAESRLSLISLFTVGSAAVFTDPPSNFNFGTPGASSTGTVSVLNGGSLNTETGMLGFAPTGSSPTGTETALGIVEVDGEDSTWTISGEQLGDAFLQIGNGSRGTGEVTISNHGKVSIAAGTRSESFVGVGASAGSVGRVSLSNGAQLNMTGDVSRLSVGYGSSSVGTLVIEAGSQINLSGATASEMLVGSAQDNDGIASTPPDAGTGSVSITGSGSSVTAGGMIVVGSPAELWGGGATGTLCVSDNGSITAGEEIYVGLEGTVCGDGSINGNLKNDSGTIAPGESYGTLTIAGDYDQGEEGKLQIELSGVGVGDYDTLAISGTVHLGGTLEIIVADGYVPSPGDSFTFITADDIFGEFDNFILPDIGDNTFTVTVFEDFAVIIVNSETAPVTPLPLVVKTTTEGSNDDLTVEIEVSLSTILENDSALLNRSSKDLVTYDVFVGALVPEGVLITEGTDESAWFLLDAAETWGQFLGGPLPEFLRNVEINSADHRVVLHLLRSADVSQFVGTTFYIGYGTSDIEMLESERYRSIFVIDE